VSTPRISVVIATYEWPEALEVMLRALAEQREDELEVVVADDGSGPETAAVVERWREHVSLRVLHAWQPDNGWRKSRILDLGALSATGDYLVFLDGDSIPRTSFLQAARRAMRPGWFLASKRLLLSRGLSRRVLEEGLPVWQWSSVRWILGAAPELVRRDREGLRPGVLLPIRDRRRPWRPGQPEFSPPYEAYGFCLGMWRSDFERVNGFDLRFENWGGEDEDIAARLRRAGLRCGWPGPKATMLHLWHEPKVGTMASNKGLVRESLASEHVAAAEGLREVAAQATANRVAASSSSSEPV
jgi:glycosyltransferase involved in cell wall biosynthesis